MSSISPASRPQLSPDGESYWNGATWVSLLSADGTQLWDGGSWVARRPQSPAPRPQAKMTWIIAGGAVAVIALIALAAFGTYRVLHLYGHVTLTGANSVAEFKAEQGYNAVYARDANRIQADAVPYAAAGSSPGVCNKGGTKQGCYDTDQKVIADIHTLIADLGRLSVPPRFKQADYDLRTGLQLNSDALSLRDQAIASNDPNASFDPSNQKAAQAVALLQQAYREFPTDNAPRPVL